MPLKQGKGAKAFEHNIKAEMHAGKPQKQALAIAYAVKRKMAQKKAYGGEMYGPDEDENYSRGKDDYLLNSKAGAQTFDTKNPGMKRAGPEHHLNEVDEERLDHHDQSHESPKTTEGESMIDIGSINAYRTDGPKRFRPEPKIGQVHLTEKDQAEHLARGGEVSAAMSRRDRAMAAMMGTHHGPDYSREGEAKRMPPAMGHKANQETDLDPTDIERAKKVKEPSASGSETAEEPMHNLSPAEQAAHLAKGGMAHHKIGAHHLAQASKHMAQGGHMMAAEHLKQAQHHLAKGGKMKHAHHAGMAAHHLEAGDHEMAQEHMDQMPPMAKGGLIEYPEAESEEHQNQFLGYGGEARHEYDNQIQSERHPYPAIKEKGSYPYHLDDQDELQKGQSEHFGHGGQYMHGGGYAKGGMPHYAAGGMHVSAPKSMAKSIMAKMHGKRMAEGGEVHPDDDRRPEYGESIDNFKHDAHPDNDFLSPEEQTEYHHLNEQDYNEPDQKARRSKLISKIFRQAKA